ncbi:MAG: type I methionyl aminopeptidase [Candidatus Paceibacterota bacterium]
MKLKNKEDIKQIKESGKILVSILHRLKGMSAPGVNLLSLDKEARLILEDAGAKSAFFGYKPSGADHPYPAYICTSLNDQIVHGTPVDYSLKESDILSIDIGVNFKGYVTDSAFTFGIGKISNENQRLLKSTKKSLENGISALKVGNTLGDIGYEIEKQINKDGFKLINGLTGHGVGFDLHEEPTVYNYGEPGSGLKLQPGMVLAIEPMASISSDRIIMKDDESYGTSDGSISAHFEKTVAVTEDGYEVMTPWEL